MKGAAKRFRITTEMEAGSWRRFQMAKCGSCDFEGRVADSTAHGAPPEMIKRKFQQIGWTMGQKPTDDECPKCVTKRALSPAQKRAAFCRINNVPRPAQPAKEKTVVAEPPRLPSIDDKRRIREALFAHYDEEKGCYTKAHSDKSVAASLNVPFAWVSQTREALGFGPDKNEAASEFTAEVLSIRKDLRAMQDDVLTDVANRFDAIEKRLNAVERAGFKGAA